MPAFVIEARLDQGEKTMNDSVEWVAKEAKSWEGLLFQHGGVRCI